MSELLGLMAGGTIFRASPRSRKRSAGLKKRRRRGCGTQHSVRALFSRSRDRIEPAIRIQMTPGAVANELGIARRVQHDAEAAIRSIAVAAAPRSAIRGRTVPGAARSRRPTNHGQKMKARSRGRSGRRSEGCLSRKPAMSNAPLTAACRSSLQANKGPRNFRQFSPPLV